MTNTETQTQLTNSVNVGVQVSPKRLKPSEEELQLKRENKILRKQLRHREKCITSMKSFIKYLKNNKHDIKGIKEVLKNNLNSVSFEVIKNELKNTKVAARGRRYSALVKQFAFTLFFYSPRAYEFVRSHLRLPHNSIFRKWLKSYKCSTWFS